MSSVRIVDRATEPDVPIGPGRSQVLLVALLGGVFLAVGLAFFVEYFDNRLKTPAAVETHLRLVSLGAIPRKRRTLRIGRRLVDYSTPSPLVEAFRQLRANVLFASPDGLKSVVVTSASPTEGKTIIAANLALGLAQAGQRVALVDADLRRPHIHAVLGLALEPGLSSLLTQRSPLEQVVQTTSVPNLMAVTAGTLPPNPAELIGSPQFTALLRLLESRFDIVVIDTPPVMVVADASILAHQTSGVLFVVDASSTSRHAAQAALDQLERAHARFLGAVLNRVDAQPRRYYRKSYFRRAGAKQPASVGTHEGRRVGHAWRVDGPGWMEVGAIWQITLEVSTLNRRHLRVLLPCRCRPPTSANGWTSGRCVPGPSRCGSSRACWVCSSATPWPGLPASTRRSKPGLWCPTAA